MDESFPGASVDVFECVILWPGSLAFGFSCGNRAFTGVVVVDAIGPSAVVLGMFRLPCVFNSGLVQNVSSLQLFVVHASIPRFVVLS